MGIGGRARGRPVELSDLHPARQYRAPPRPRTSVSRSCARAARRSRRPSRCPRRSASTSPIGPGTDVPELTNERFGALITSDQPIVVERAMYSDAARSDLGGRHERDRHASAVARRGQHVQDGFVRRSIDSTCYRTVRLGRLSAISCAAVERGHGHGDASGARRARVDAQTLTRRERQQGPGRDQAVRRLGHPRLQVQQVRRVHLS